MKAAERMEDVIIPMAEALKEMPSFIADDQLVTHISHGRALSPEPFTDGHLDRPPAEYIKVVDRSNRLKAVIEWSSESGTYVYCCVFK